MRADMSKLFGFLAIVKPKDVVNALTGARCHDRN